MFSKLLLPALVLGALGLLVTLAESHGYSRAERDQAKQQNKALQEAQAARDALQAKIDNMAGENAELVNQLRNTKLEVSKYATDAQRGTGCNLTLGAVSLLNVRRGYAEGTGQNPGLAAREDRQASTITGEESLREWEQCEIDYSLAVTRLDGLIDSCSVLQ